MTAKCGIYAIVNPAQHAVYVGSSVNIECRLARHRSWLVIGRHHCIHLQRAWNKYGPSAFKFIVVEECSRVRLRRVEQLWLDFLPLLYNTNPSATTPPSRRGSTMSAENRAKQSARFKSIVRTEQWRKRIGDAQRGKTASEHTRRLLSEARNGRPLNDKEKAGRIVFADKLRGRSRPPFSAETRAEMSASQKLKQPDTQETRAKKSAASRVRRHTDATRAKISASIAAHWVARGGR